MPGYAEVTDEEVEQHVEKEVSQVVPRGTLSPGHLKPISSLPKEYQVEVSEKIVHQGLSVRDTEEKVQRLHEEIEHEKRFKEVLEKARQPNCPYCGAVPRGLSHSEKYLVCSKCYNSWDFMVTKAELEEQKRQSEKGLLGEKSQRLKDAHANPAYIRRMETVEEIDAKIKPWLLKKLHELDGVISISVMGSRGKDIVSIDYPGSWGKSLQFNIGQLRSKSAFYPYDWQKRFFFSMQNKDYKKVEANSKLDISNPSPETREELHRFLDEVLDTDRDPFLPTKKGETE